MDFDDPAGRGGRGAHGGRPRARRKDRAGHRQTPRGKRAKTGDIARAPNACIAATRENPSTPPSPREAPRPPFAERTPPDPPFARGGERRASPPLRRGGQGGFEAPAEGERGGRGPDPVSRPKHVGHPS